MISSTVSLIQSPYSRREAVGKKAPASGDGRAASPVDMTELSVPSESDRAPWVSWKKAGAALLLAAPIVAGALTDAHAAVAPPTDPTVSCAPAEDVSLADFLIVPNLLGCKYTGPLSESDVSIMKSLAVPSARDNKTALKVRDSYRRLADTVQQHDQRFRGSLATLQAQEDVLKAYAERNPGTYTESGRTVEVEKFAEGNNVVARITVTTDTSIAMLVDRVGARRVIVMGPDQHISLLENDSVRQIDDGNVKRSWFLKDVEGHAAGNFEVVVRHPDGLVAGSARRLQHLVVHGASITNTTSERLSGFAGNIDVYTLDSFQVPDPSVPNQAGVQLRETSYSFSESAPTKGVHYTAVHEVDVRQDGSTRVRDGDGLAGTPYRVVGPWVEEPAAAAQAAK